MYGNLISLITQVLTPDVIAKMGQACGISDRTIAQKAVAAAVPALFFGFANLASKPDGARLLADTIADQPPNTLDGLASSAGGFGQLADIGKTALDSLFGRNAFGSLASALGQYAGVGEGAVRSLLGMIEPVVLGVLGREAGSGASGLAQLLASQTDGFAARMPNGLSDLLGASGVFAPVAAVPSVNRVNETYRAARERAGSLVRAISPSTSQPSSAGWMYWALPLLALAGLLWYLFGGQRTEPIAQAPPQAKVAQSAAVVSDLQPQLASVIDSLSSTLSGPRDWSSARDVLPKLQQSASELDRLTALANRLPLETRERPAETIKTATARLKSGLDNVSAMPRVAPDAKPVIAALRARLDALAMTPASLAQQRIGHVADKVVYLARSPSDAVWISTYFDRTVRDGNGEKVGVIHDLIMGPDARIAAAVVGVGGFLGIGEKEVAVPLSAMQVVRRDNDWLLVLDTTKDALKDAPAYEATGERVRLKPTPGTKR